MDISETYVKMRLAAIPDLGLGKFPSNPGHIHKIIGEQRIFTDNNGDWFVMHFKTNYGCQLERQDQLQAMVEVEEYPYTLVEKFWVWFSAHNNSDEDIEYESMEQLWMSFVMKELYNKTWNGEDWVKI